MAVSLAMGLVIGVVCLALIVGKPRGWGHVAAAAGFLICLVVAFALSALVVSLAEHRLTGKAIQVDPVGPARQISGSAFYAFLVVEAFVVTHWYSVLPLVVTSYGALTLAGKRHPRGAA